MSKIIAAAAIRGAHDMVKRAEGVLAQAIEEHGKDKKVEYPDTAYYLPIMLLFLGQKVQNLGDLEESLQEARKLLKLTLSLGGSHRRQVFAGIKAAYQPEDLVGRLVVMVANLKPRKMKFGLSEGMVCASGPGGEDVFLLSPDNGALPGQRVH